MTASASQCAGGTLVHPARTIHPDDATLVAAARAHPSAFAPLYERYLPSIFRFCHLRLGSREAAEDAASEVFLKAFGGLAGYRDGVFAAWLFRIAHNVVNDVHRRRRPATGLDDAGGVYDPAPLPADAAVASLEREALRAALARLPEEQRVTIELGLAGMTGEEIAQVLGKSQAAVKMLRFRAITRLRTLLGAEAGAEEGHDA